MPRTPRLPVLIEVVVDGKVIHTALACDFRQDLRDAGYGLGRGAFFITLPEDVPANLLDTVQVRRAGDGAELPMTGGLPCGLLPGASALACGIAGAAGMCRS